MTIVFNNIPKKVGVPGVYTEFDGRLARSGLVYRTVRHLLVGFASETGLNMANPNQPYQVTSLQQANVLFGSGSMLSSMFKSTSQEDSFNEIWMISTPQVGIEAEYTATFSGTPTDTGTASLYVGSDFYSTTVFATSTASDIATALQTRIAANLDATYTATVAGAVLTIKMNFKGEIGNDLQVSTFYEDEVLPSGLSCVIARSVDGVGVPDVTDVILSIQELDFTDISFPFTDDFNMDLIEAEADSRWEPLPALGSVGSGEKDFHIYSAYRGNESEISLWHDKRNNQHVTVYAAEPKTSVGLIDYMGFRSPVWEITAAYGGLVGNVSGQDPNTNLQNLQFNSLKGAPKVSRWSFYERNRMILNHGMATFKYTLDGMGDDVMLERATTCRRFLNNGQKTDAEMDTETQKLNSFLRWDLRNYLLTLYPNHKLSDDGIRQRPSNVITPREIKASVYARAVIWAENGYIENLKEFREYLQYERSTDDCNTVNGLLRPDHVNQLRVINQVLLYKVC
jgi:phage tail sheath gpL-like